MFFLITIIFAVIITSYLYFILKVKTNQNNIEIIEEQSDLVIEEPINYFPKVEVIEDKTLVPLEKNKILDEEIKKVIAAIDNTNSKDLIVEENLQTENDVLNNKKTSFPDIKNVILSPLYNIIPKFAITCKNLQSAKEVSNPEKSFFSTTDSGIQNMIIDKKTNTLMGTQMVNGKFTKQTRFLNEDKMIKMQQGKNFLVNAGFNATSMVVGQYYMAEINDKLERIQQEISWISNYLDSEYQGKLAYIVSKIKEIIDNKIEILNNEYSRDKRYSEVLDLETNCAVLLGQANNIIKENKNYDENDYRRYEEKVREINKWLTRQKILQRLLLEIGNLRYILANGNETSKLSHTQYNTYLEQTNKINEELANWHRRNFETLGIDIEKRRRKGDFFDIRIFAFRMINEEWAYDRIEDDVLNIINKQTEEIKMAPYDQEKQDEKIKIQKYNGEYYNILPDAR